MSAGEEQIVSFKTENGMVFQGKFLRESEDGFYFKDIHTAEGTKETEILKSCNNTIKFDKSEIIWIKMP